MDEFLKQVLPLITTTLVGVALAFIGYAGRLLVKLMPTLIDYTVSKIGLNNYKKSQLIALDVWYAVEEHFRVSDYIGDKVTAKQLLFENLIKRKMPTLSDADMKLLRQGIAGELNKIKASTQL